MLKKQQSKGRLSQIARDLENGGLDGGDSLSPNSVRSMLNAFRKPLGLPLLQAGKNVTSEQPKLKSAITNVSNIRPSPEPEPTIFNTTPEIVRAEASKNLFDQDFQQDTTGTGKLATTATVELFVPVSGFSAPVPPEHSSNYSTPRITSSFSAPNLLPESTEPDHGAINLSGKSCTNQTFLSLSELRREGNITNNNESDMSWKTTCSVSPAPAFSSEVSTNKTGLPNAAAPAPAIEQNQYQPQSAKTTASQSGISTMGHHNFTELQQYEEVPNLNSVNPAIATSCTGARQSNNYSSDFMCTANTVDPDINKENITNEKLELIHDTKINSCSVDTYKHSALNSKTFYRIPCVADHRLSTSSADVGRKGFTTGINVYTNSSKEMRSTVDDNERPIFNSAVVGPQSQGNLQSNNEASKKSGIPRTPFKKGTRISENCSADISRKTLTNLGMSGELRTGNNTGDVTYKKLPAAPLGSFCTPVTKSLTNTMMAATGSNSRVSSSQKTGAGNSKKKQPNFWKLTTEKVCETSYLILKQLGKGGCGEVYLVMENESRQLHALKKVNMQQLDSAGVQECINEVQMLLALRDTELVIRIMEWEVDQTNNVLKIVMEYGQCDLSKTIISKSATLTKVKSCFENMLLIVQAIHSKGIVHGDLKPANFVWVAGRLKIIDFGIANRLQTDVTSIQTYNPKGTLNFMSPESIRPDAYGRAKIGPKSDIWSLGCILYLMVYGFAPFQNYQNQIAKMNAIINGTIEYPPLPTHLCDEKMLDVMQLCFQLDSRKRPDATDLLKHAFLSA